MNHKCHQQVCLLSFFSSLSGNQLKKIPRGAFSKFAPTTINMRAYVFTGMPTYFKDVLDFDIEQVGFDYKPSIYPYAQQ